ncbi:hypothetical protein [uncultured Kordia sp.]|uniref:hypothetical protein n=1 Tax=uncultured Kordia sp. TaxID=507699 RepID=UPI0026099A85|nr:hypothetical protein [uncultured Kordia sp.]
MLKSISNLGTVLDKKEQRQITGKGMIPVNPRECRFCSGEWLEDFGLCALPIGSPCGGFW